MQTVVAVVAVVSVILLAEVVQQHLAAAHTGLGVCCGFCQQLSADVLFSNGFAFHELVEFLQVLMGIEGDAHALAAVASCTSCFLIVSLQ